MSDAVDHLEDGVVCSESADLLVCDHGVGLPRKLGISIAALMSLTTAFEAS